MGSTKYMKLNEEKKLKNRKYLHDRSLRLRRLLIDAFGGECSRCGFKDIRALQIDHVNGGGAKERREQSSRSSSHNLKYVNIRIDSFLKGENKYQLLCANCNWIKRIENKEFYKL